MLSRSYCDVRNRYFINHCVRVFAAILAGGVFWGCAARGPQFAPKIVGPERAVAYVYRPSSWETHDGPLWFYAEGIYLNGKHAGDLHRFGYLALELDPGPVHILDSERNNVTFTAEPGKTYFIRYSWKSGLRTVMPQLTMMEPEVGAREIVGCRYSE